MMQKWQEELKKGNEKAFSIIFNEYYSLLCAVSYQYVQDVQISEAVAEDVFFTLWEKRHEALPVSSLKAYLLKAVRNHSIDYLRTQKNEQFLDLESVTSRCFVREEDIFERYVMEEDDKVWLCTYLLKQYGIDLKKWREEGGEKSFDG